MLPSEEVLCNPANQKHPTQPHLCAPARVHYLRHRHQRKEQWPSHPLAAPEGLRLVYTIPAKTTLKHRETCVTS
ncbi:unnamed protein product [Boreogadus saida]